MPWFYHFAWKWVHAKGNGVRKTKECHSSNSHPLPTKPAILGHRQTKGIFPFPLLTIRYLYMFTLRIKSSSGLESVAHSQFVLFSGASRELPFQGCSATPWTKEGSPQPEPTGTVQYSSWQTWEITQCMTTRTWFQLDKLSPWWLTGLSCQAPAHPLSLHWDFISPSGDKRAVVS